MLHSFIRWVCLVSAYQVSSEAITMDEDSAYIPINLEAAIHEAYHKVEQALLFVPPATMHRLLRKSLDKWHQRRHYELGLLHDPNDYFTKSDLEAIHRKLDTLGKTIIESLSMLELKISRKLNGLEGKIERLEEDVDRKINALEDRMDKKMEIYFERTIKENLKMSPVRQSEVSRTQREYNQEREKSSKDSTGRKEMREGQKVEKEWSLASRESVNSVVEATNARIGEIEKKILQASLPRHRRR